MRADADEQVRGAGLHGAVATGAPCAQRHGILAPLLLPCTVMHSSARSLDQSLARGIAWTGGVKWLTSLLTWGITILVARTLSPADYGLVGMAMVFIGLAQLTSDVGLAATIIQVPDLREPLAARLGGAAIMIAAAIAAVTVGGSALIAGFFREPAVQWIAIALSGTFVLRGVQVLRRAMMTRALRFRQLAWIDGIEAVVTSVSTLAYATLGLRYWALVGGLLTGVGVSTLLLVVAFPHRLHFPRRIAELEGTLAIGAQVLGGQVAWYAYSTADMIIVGRMLGSTALGAYTFAWVLASIAVERIASLMGRVTPAIFAAVQHDHAALRRYVYTLTEGLALITMPICIGIALVADLIVQVALGESWLAAIAPMRLLAIYAAVRCIAVILPQLLVFTGRARQSMYFNLFALVVLVPLFILGASWSGTTGVAWAWVLAYPAITAVTYLRYLRTAINLSIEQYLGALRPAVIATATMAVAVLLTRRSLAGVLSPFWLLVALIGAGALAYGALLLVLHRRRLTTVLALLRSAESPSEGPSEGPDETAREPSGSAEPPPTRGRILLICYHFAPDPAIGSLRWQKFARHAAERGWGLDVIMRDERSIAAPDAERIADLPPGVRRVGVSERPFWFDTLEDRLARLYRRFVPRTAMADSLPTTGAGPAGGGRDLVRAYFAFVLLLRERRWARDAADAALAMLDRDVHRVVIGCGPPSRSCIAARHVARSARLPLVTDLRDPWSLAQRLPEAIASPVSRLFNRREERLTVEASALVVTNSAPVGDAMRALYPASRIIDVPNGYDADPMPAPTARDRFVLAYSGTIYFGRDPRALFQALARVVQRHSLSPAEIGMDLMGAVAHADGVPLGVLAEEAGVGGYVHLHATRPRSEALAFLAGASLLVMLPQDVDMSIPGKIYEYMRFDAWLLALAHPGSATARLLRGSEASVVAAADVEAIAAVIERRFLQHRAGERGTPVAVAERFSRRARAAAFFGALDLVVPPPRRPAPAMVRAPQRASDTREGREARAARSGLEAVASDRRA